MKKDDIITVEEGFNVSREVVWEAITDPEKMRLWFFDNIPDFKPEVGFETEFNVNSGERDFLHQWKILEVIPLKKITYNWKYEEYSGNAHVTFELLEEGTLTRLVFSIVITDSFQEDIPEFTYDSCLGGWKYFINDRLKNFLANT